VGTQGSIPFQYILYRRHLTLAHVYANYLVKFLFVN